MPATDDEPRRRRVVGDHVGQREPEVLESRVDDLGSGSDRGNRSEGLGSADRAGQRGAHQEGDLRLDTGMHVVGERHGAAVSDAHRAGQAAPDHLVDADLGHLRTRGEAHLDADQPLTALPAAADRLRLDGVRAGDTEIDGVGELSDRGGRAGRLVGPFGEFAE